MKGIGEKQILEKQISRYMELITLLNMNNSSMDIIVAKMGVTDKTIYADIQEFNSFYKPARIEIDEYKHLYLHTPSNMSMGDLYAKILNSSVTVSALKEIYINEPTLKELGGKIFLSETSIRRNVLRWNQFFKQSQYNIEIIITPKLMVTGNELSIRQFFYQMFLEIYNKECLPQYSLLQEGVLKCLKKLKAPKQHLSVYIETIFFIMAALIRVSNGHYYFEKADGGIPENKKIVRKIIDILQNFTVLSPELGKRYGFVLNERNVNDVLPFKVAWLCQNELDVKTLTVKEKKEYEAVGVFLKQLFKKLNLENTCNDNLHYEIFRFLQFQWFINSFQINYHDIFYHQLKQKSPILTEIFEECIQESKLSKQLKQNKSLYKELLIKIVMLEERMLDLIEPNLKKKTILIISDESVSLGKMYKQLISRRYPFLNKIDIHIEDTISDYGYINQYDMVLSESELNPKKFSSDFLKLSKIPTALFWENFDKVLYS
ncbi:hypothetical protein IGL98_000478 [Enterococcus sp. DIV0840]|uniref:helix-turn-helix domain-containing protein n=1 Tax=unclassified Enterococcus TaxID=2608891 RepID=UPI001A8FF71D|nr:helix-turn-helix domain-containing protein [Enterococcus sp. DIV0849a]MBO0433521.1 helix-turn-helix domain-containing protein [Enterococcus sp. DIV0849a]